MKKLVLAAIGVALAAAGIAGAVALTTGTVSVCAPAHTVAVDGKAVATIPAQCVTTTYAVPTVTQTVTVTTPSTTTTPSTSAGGYGIIAEGDTLSNYSATHKQGATLITVTAGPDATAAAALPGRSLIYMDADLIRYDGGSGVNYTEASNAGYLTGAVDGIYPAVYAKIDNAAYQQWFAQKAVALAQRYGVDGIWLDDVSASGNPAYTPTTQKPAMKAIAQATGSALHAAGLYLMTSANGFEPLQSGSDDGTRDLAWWEQIAPYVDGITTEYWQETRDGSDTLRLRGTDSYVKFWDQWQAAASQFHADFPTKDFSGITFGPDSKLTYGRASLLLANPTAVFFGQHQDGTDSVGAWASCPNPAVNPVVGSATC
jgi:hypothetical protein